MARCDQLIETIFFSHYKLGKTDFPFKRDEIESAAAKLGIKLPKNLGDVIYTFLPSKCRCQKAAAMPLRQATSGSSVPPEKARTASSPSCR